MKRLLCIAVFLCIILLPGCKVKEELAFEYILDEIPQLPAAYLDMDLPENVLLTESADQGRFAVFSHRDYEVIQEVFPAESPEDAISYLSGREASDLLVLTPKKDAYRFAWTTASEEGDIACSALLLSDGAYYYSILIRCPASLEKNYRKDFSHIFSSIQLQWV